MAGEWKNRVGNVAATPVRAVVGAPAHALVDLSKTATGYYKNVQDISMETLNEIQETISDAGKKGKWYHKLVNIPIAGVGSAAKSVTGAVQAAINPIVNGVFDFAKTGWGFLKNEFNTIKSTLSTKPMSDFSFEKLKLTPTWKSRWHPKNLLIGGVAATAVAAKTSSPSTPVPTPTPKTVVDEDSKKTIADLTQKFEQQEKANQDLQKTMLAMKDQMEKQTQLMQQQLKQKDDIIATLQTNNTKQIAKDAIGNQVGETLDVANESPKKKSLEKQAANIKEHIDTLIPDSYTTRIDTPGGYQRIVISDPEKEEKKKPEFYLTLSDDGKKAKLHYSPYDHYGEFYYYGEVDANQASLGDIVTTITQAMAGSIDDMAAFESDLEKYGVVKKVASKDVEPKDISPKKKGEKKKEGVVA